MNSKKRRILVVDDIEINAQILVITLEKEFDVVSASSGKHALSIVQSDNPPDLILLDIMMPGMNGYEVCEKIKENEATKEIPVIFITAKSSIEDIVQGFDVGGVDYIEKPFQNEEVLARVKTHLDLRHAKLEVEKRTRELEESQEKLIQSEKMSSLGQLVAGLAHEINTPIGIGVTGASYLHDQASSLKNAVQGDSLKKSELNSYLSNLMDTSALILNNLKRTAALVQSFKLVASDQSFFEKRTIDLREYLEEVFFSLTPEYKIGEHKISVTCLDNVKIETFPGAIAQIFTNLLMNSIKHGFEGQKKGEISLEIQQKGKDIIMTYRDNGKGIQKSILKKIFDPFFTTKRNRGGTGLGLHIVYNTVTQTLGGHISCESALNQGTVFTIEIPQKI